MKINKKKQTYTKSNLAVHMAAETGLTVAQADKAVDAFIAAVEKFTTEGHDVLLKNFGKFEMVTKESKEMKSFGGEEIIVPEKKILKFTMARRKKAALQGNTDFMLLRKALAKKQL